MTDEEIRALVRDAVSRHLGTPAPAAAATTGQPVPPPAWRAHPSFGRFLLVNSDDNAACLIEPTVRCNHCGFCQSYGH